MFIVNLYRKHTMRIIWIAHKSKDIFNGCSLAGYIQQSRFFVETKVYLWVGIWNIECTYRVCVMFRSLLSEGCLYLKPNKSSSNWKQWGEKNVAKAVLLSFATTCLKALREKYLRVQENISVSHSRNIFDLWNRSLRNSFVKT